MNEHSNPHPSAGPSNADVITLVRKMQQQLEFLEKKIDLLINQSRERPAREQRFPRPSRPSFGPPHRRDDESREHGPAAREFRPGRRFEKRPGEQQGFGPKKKPFFNKRKDRG